VATRRTLKIVISENGENNGNGFGVFLEGDKERIGSVPTKKLSPAEYWATRLFGACMRELQEAGVIVAQVDMSGKEAKH
jgi:hypothetical protein